MLQKLDDNGKETPLSLSKTSLIDVNDNFHRPVLMFKNSSENLFSSAPFARDIAREIEQKISNNGKIKTFDFSKKFTTDDLKNYECDWTKHVKPTNLSESVAYAVVRTLRTIADVYFAGNYVRRAVILETVAAIPGIVGGLFRHLYSLRNLKDNGETIKKLVDEAENERQHLLTFLEVLKPNLFDRFVIKFTQLWFFNAYMIFYFLAPKTAHRFVGYLEEEAIRSYTCFEDKILNGDIYNYPAPEISKKYWNLPTDAKLLDVVRAVRADEAEHRDVNHHMADDPNFSLGTNHVDL
ncbi:Alternative oxidase [Pseudoloma neurophilia]|uniref:Alternative oxidase n=1 Tax=Pseudoloma neurophilia TaxID=146866 RepID=A0A0R0LSL5_9MICR|nr:Alternative oxidase [Pseudoloma neurophilia]